MRNKIVPLLNKLSISIYLVGYNKLGESIVFVVENDFGIFYCGVIDSFECNDVNNTIKILDQLGVKSLNLLVCTHPHEDHTLGMCKLINNYVTEDTRIIYPSNVYNVNQEVESIRETTEKITEILNSRKRKKPKLIGVNGYSPIYKCQIGNQISKSFEFQIIALSPVTEIVEKRIFNGRVNTPNDYSISLLISIGGINFFLGGDIQNTTIDKIEQMYLPNKIDYVKIPHHASRHSTKLLGWFNRLDKSSISCTTEYSSSGLPNMEVIGKYKSFFNEIYTTNINPEKPVGVGIIKTVYDVLGNKFFTTPYGDGGIIHKDELIKTSKKL